MKKTVVYSYEEGGPTPETKAKVQPDWWDDLVKNKIIDHEQRDIGAEIRAGFEWVIRPVDWNLGDLEKLGKGHPPPTDEGGEPDYVVRYYAWCKEMQRLKKPIRSVLDFVADGTTCKMAEFSDACKTYVAINGWRWRW